MTQLIIQVSYIVVFLNLYNSSNSYCKTYLPTSQQRARSSSLEVGFTTSVIVITALPLIYSQICLS